MAALIIALFVIVVVWGWYLIPKKAGAHKASTLNVRGRQSKTASQVARSKSTPDVQVVPAAGTRTGYGAPVPVVGGNRSGATNRRRRVRAVLIAMAVLSAAAALYTGSVNWWLTHAASDALLLIYFGLALQLQDGKAASTNAAPATQQESQPALRRVAGG
ncbi:MAG: hypothetical protein J4G00_08235 [Actinomycetia bacterium]|nr:hypothetical protein [Actinomycetes bacterium]